MGLFSGIGSILNDVTGATSAGQSGQKYSKRLAAMNNAYQKEFAQNGVQWRAEDLEKAGFNRALAATDAASASGGGGFNGTGMGGNANPVEMINSIIGTMNQTSATKSQNKLNENTGTAELINAMANWQNSNVNSNNSNAGLLGKVIGGENATKVTKAMNNARRNKNDNWFHFEVKKRN